MKPRILLVDDCSNFLKVVSLTLQTSFEIDMCANVSEAKRMLSYFEYMAAVLDLHFEGENENGTHLLDILSSKYPKTRTIVITGHSNAGVVIKASKQRHDVLLHKDADLIKTLERNLFNMSEQFHHQESTTAHSYPSISPKIKNLLNDAERILKHPGNASILVTGETGSGKEVFVQYLVSRLNKRVVSVSMANVQKETGESILFGHEKGAFTGALQSKVGLIESAHQGVMFLDEIGECSLSVQAKLLRTLQEQKVTPLGSNNSRSVDVRFIAATHQNIPHMIDQGLFRYDLYQRINTFSLHLPPLRERPEDIGFYARLFLDKLSPTENRYYLDQEAENHLLQHLWPGNIRELRNVIQRAIVYSNSLEIGVSIIEKSMIEKTSAAFRPATTSSRSIDRGRVTAALLETHGNKRQAARILGVSEMTIYRWLK